MDLELDLAREFMDLGGQYGLYGPHLELGHATFGRKAQRGLINLVEFPKKGGSQARSCVCSALRPTTPEGRNFSYSGDEGEGSSALLCLGFSNQDSKLPLIHGINRCRARVKRQCGGLDDAPDSDDSAPPNMRPSTMLHRNEAGVGTGAPHEDQEKFTSFPNPPRIQFSRRPRTTPGRPGPRLAKGKPHGLRAELS